MKPNYWLIKWNAKAKGEKRSSRMFRTFFRGPELFEAYGYIKDADARLFDRVKERDQVFCYQKDEGKIVGLCEVETTETGKQNGVGGPSLVLRARVFFLPGSKWTKQVGNIYELSKEEIEKIFNDCGLK